MKFQKKTKTDLLEALIESLELVLNGLVQQEVNVHLHVLVFVIICDWNVYAVLFQWVHLDLVEYHCVYSEAQAEHLDR